MHLTLCYIVLVCHQDYVSGNSIGSVFVGGYGGLSESVLCVFQCSCCPTLLTSWIRDVNGQYEVRAILRASFSTQMASVTN